VRLSEGVCQYDVLATALESRFCDTGNKSETLEEMGDVIRKMVFDCLND
jgi:hypothetical protein